MDLEPQNTRVRCECGTESDLAVWELLDLQARPDLLNVALSPDLNATICPGCGERARFPDGLLVWAPDHVPFPIFVPSADSREGAIEQFEDLIKRVNRQRAAHGHPALPSDAIMASSSTLRRALTSDVLADLEAFEAGTFPQPENSAYRLFLTHVQRGRDRRLSHEPMLRFVDDLTYGAAASTLAQFPALHTAAAARYLRAEITAARDRGDTDVADLLSEHLRLLPAAAPAERGPGTNELPDTPLGPQSELRLIVHRLDEIGEGANPRLALTLANRALGLAEPGTNPQLWASLHFRGAAEVSRTDDQDLVDEWIGRLQAAAAQLTEGDYPWRQVMTALAAIWCERRRNGAQNIEEAIAVYQRLNSWLSPERDPREWAIVQGNLAIALRRRGKGARIENLDAAAGVYRSAARVLTEHGFSDDAVVVLANLGAALAARAAIDRAPAILAEAIANLEKAVAALRGRDSQILAVALNNLAGALAYRGEEPDLPRAAEVYRSAAEMYRKLGSPVRQAMALMNEASILIDSNFAQLDRAVATLEECLEIFRREDAPQLQGVAALRLASCYDALPAEPERRSRQEALLHESLAVLSPQAALHEYLTAARMLAVLVAAEGRWSEVAASLGAAVEAADLQYEANTLQSHRRIELLSSQDLHRLAAYANARAGDPLAACLLLERGCARVLRETLRLNEANLEAVRTSAPAQYQAFVGALQQLDALEAEDSAGILADMAEDPTSLVNRTRAARDALGAAVERIRTLPGQQMFLVSDGALPPSRPREAQVYLVTTDWGTAAVIRCGETAEVLRIDSFTSGSLNELLYQYRDGKLVGGYVIGQLIGSRQLRSVLFDLLPRLGTGLIGVLAARLRSLDVTTVAMIPTGALGVLPLHAARYQLDGRDVCLVDEFDVLYAPYAGLLQNTGSPDVKARLLAVADPRPLVNPLPLSGAELSGTTSHIRDQTVLEGDAATLAKVMSYLPDATYVHVCAHGSYDVHDPLASAIELAQGDELTVRDLLNGQVLRKARLVLASSCQTGLHDAQMPDEHQGFAGAFLAAGADGVLCTLWPVYDLAAMLLIDRFCVYHFEGDSETGEPPLEPPAALSRAQRWLRHVRAGELARLFELQLGPAGTEPGPAWKVPHAVAIEAATTFAFQDPSHQPYADEPVTWAPFILVGR
jgi:CHAT domain-containing protein